MGIILGMVGACVVAAILDGAFAEERKKELDKMTPDEREMDRKFWDRMMQ